MKKSIKLLTLVIAVMTLLSVTVLFTSAAVTAPERPASVSTKKNSTTVVLSWKAPKGATGYRIYRSVNGKWKAIKTTTKTTYVVENLKPATSYKFAVKPYTKSGGKYYWSKNYRSVSVTTEKKNAVAVNATKGADYVSLTWSKSSSASGYRVYQKVDGKWKTLKTTTGREYKVTGLTASTNYQFCVKSYIKADGKTYWNKYYTSIKVKTDSMPKFSFKGKVKSDTVTLSWSSCKGATGYRVYEKVNGKWTKVKTLSEKITSYTISGHKKNTSYVYTVKAYAKTDKGVVWSNLPSGYTAKIGDYTKTKISKATAGTDTVTLKWSAVPNATGYRIYNKVNGTLKSLKIVYSTGTSYTLTGLNSDTVYNLVVRGFKKADGKTTWFTSSDAKKVVTEPTEKDLVVSRYNKYSHLLEGDHYVSFTSKAYVDGELYYDLPGGLAEKYLWTYVYGTTEDGNCRILYDAQNKDYYFVYDDKEQFVYLTPEQAGKVNYADETKKAMGFFVIEPKITVSIEKFDGKNVVCEAYTTRQKDYSDETITVKTYYAGKEIVGTMVDYGDGMVEYFYIDKFVTDDAVPSSLFTIPSDYQGYVITE